MPIFKFVQDLWTHEFEVIARRYTSDGDPIFRTFIVRDRNSYEAAHQFDTSHQAWTRLSLIRKS